MTQHNMKHYMNTIENKNIEIKSEIEKTENFIEENKNENDKYWLAEEVTQYVMDFLIKKFPESIIIRETNGKVDIMILDENLPVEIQSTIITKTCVHVSNFEDSTRRQLKQNVSISGRCWLFCDEKFIKHLNVSTNRNISINLNWLFQLWKSEEVKIFTITYNGIIKEMIKDDWKFLPKISSDCKISIDDDYKILQKNKSKILFNVLKELHFTTKEINNMYKSYESRVDKKESNFGRYLKRNNTTEREILYANIIASSYLINILNKTLNVNIEEDRMDRHIVQHGSSLGLFERNAINTNSSNFRVRFCDKYDIAKYFPGYIRNKEMWDYLKIRWLNRNEFYGLVTGTFQYTLIKNQSTIMDYK